MLNKHIKFIVLILFLGSFWGCENEIPTEKFLRVQDQNFVDGNGKKVFLKSVGLGNWLLPEGYMWKFGNLADRPRKIEALTVDLLGKENADQFWQDFRKFYITEADIKRIAELGFNCVRPAMNSRLFLTEGENPQFIEENFKLLDDLMEWCKKYDVYVVLDMHGAPGGQTGENIDDSPNDEPELFMYEKNQDLLVDLWVNLADRYKDNPTLIAYDLLNEPLPARDGSAEKYGHLVEPLYKRITDEIRKVDSLHMITLEGVDWSNDWSIFTEVFDDNTFYQFHYYCWNRPDHLNSVQYFIDERERLNTPVWVGETGEKNNKIYWGTTQYFEANDIHWSFWPWKKMDTKNTPYSINRPDNWDLVLDYLKGGEKPSVAESQKIFNEVIENIKLENCVFFEDVTNSIFRRVPVTIEAENYGHDGFERSYFVFERKEFSEYYRTSEPVQIKMLEDGNDSEQYVVLERAEWTAYEVGSDSLSNRKVTIKARGEGETPKLKFDFNGNKYEFDLTDSWQEYELNGVEIMKGNNKIKTEVLFGIANLDWIKIE
ncbi:MAG: cellulase family glycosylhydrolase [Melioribacteraceae bacterium]|nr:cellulase family glycosylhydrolase [Melioribacteraceae bacterium]MCF8263903.1 cellulase family glycosylhydrolase [Melioribacteraceae bacterium]MCF8430308.1 cellulase family glycosylhydrolase [Melioribacteraceae bacterium]